MTNRNSLVGAGISVALMLAVSGVARADDASEKAQLEQRVRDLESQLSEVKSTLRGGYFTANSDLEARVADLERAAGDMSMGSMFKNGVKSEGGDGAFKYQWFGMIQNDWAWYWDNGDNYGAAANPGTEFRRIRLGANGQIYGNVKWHAELDFAHNTVSTADLWMELAHCSFGNIRVGHMKEPAGFDWQTNDRYNEFMERNYVNDLQNGRNTGIMLHGRCSDDAILYQIGMFREANSSGDDVGNAKAGEYNLAGRVAMRPIVEDDGATWLHLGLSASWRDYADDTLSLAAKPGVNLGPTIAGGTFGVEDGWQWGLEAAYVTGPISLLGEFASINADGVSGGSDLDADALSLEAGYWLTGEAQQYEASNGSWARPKVKQNFGDGDGTGAWQLALRWQKADYDVSDITAWTFGVNWWLNPNTRVTFDWTHANPDDPTFTDSLDALGLRFQLDF